MIALVHVRVQHLTRGTLSGNGRFAPYGKILAAEGLIRIVPAWLLSAAGVTSPSGTGCASRSRRCSRSLVALRGQHGLLTPGPEAPWSELSTNLSWLFTGSLLSQVLSYSPVPRRPGDRQRQGPARLVADFIVGFFLARIPILLFQAVQAALLPKLAGLAGAGQHADFRLGVRKLVFVVVGIGVIGVIAAGTLGAHRRRDPLRRQVHARQRRPRAPRRRQRALHPRPDARAGADRADGPRRATWAWLAGNVAFWIVTAVATDDLFLRVELGLHRRRPRPPRS